ncbi:hypothetical protein RKE29_12985 [Streptomyces sp. B1866]|uniref:hypothetical protein n=1 Tax=Streptomyces sp. B1866 TaxID=3075431 RepID=UPI00289065B0|nr:hypothetical protein [Streptomyces sp. B1866]MDT3397555.1 hypothetical protein [Streptomyces sp. B1866]
MARSSNGVVATLTAGALAVVGFLAYQASATAPTHPTQARPGASPSEDAHGGGKGGGGRTRQPESTAVPGSSGTGLRVVYALGARRVWLVGSDDKAIRTFKVFPSSVSPEPGSYPVSSRRIGGLGSDGVPVEHVVVFDTEGDVVFGFSAAVDGSTPDPGATKKTGAVREKRGDALAMWRFAQLGTRVVVMP